jgi:uncharacterized phosphosugar-binding protein
LKTTLKYFQELLPILETAIQTQEKNIQQLSRWMANAIAKNHLIYVFGAGHAGIIAEEMCYRAGSLVPTNAILTPGLTLNTRPLTLETKLERLPGFAALIVEECRMVAGDVLIVHSNSGRNTVAIEMAESAKAKGILVVALTSVAHSQSVQSRHPQGWKLMDIADLVIDNCGVPGDAVVAFKGFDQKSGATSTVVGAALMNAAICETVQLLIDEGLSPPVFRSANLDGSDAYNQQWLDHYAGRLIYI